jgi:hypothetical protein
MINAYNLTEQTLEPGDYVTFNGYNFGGNRWCNADQNSLTITRTGTYEIEGIVNATPTVEGQMQFNLTRNGTNIPGGFIYLPGTTVDVTENGSTKVVVNAYAGTTFGLRNNTVTNPVTIPEQATSIIIRRIA